MSHVPRKTRVQIAAKVGVDERVVLAVLEGRPARYPAVTKQITAELKKLGITPAPQQGAEPPPDAEPTTSTPTGEG